MAFEILNVGAVSNEELSVGGGRISVEFLDGPFETPPAELNTWISNAARAVSAYYGAFPVHHVRLEVQAVDGRDVHGGETFPANDGGGLIKIRIGRVTREAELNDDWTLTHEMVHLGFPMMEREHHWIEEGLATYVEPWARVRIGTLTPEKVWTDVVRDMPKGLPEAGDQGLDRTHTWGRTYWGGALFCLLADLEIRERTGNKKGLTDALRAIHRAGGSIAVEWPIEKALKVGDDGVGVPVLTELYRKMANHAAPVDLESIWKRLGVTRARGTIVLDDTAPLAAIRKGIEKGDAHG